MTQRVGLLNGTNITYDKDLTAGLLATTNQWVIEGLGITGTWASANVLPWKALIECIRTNGEKVMVFFENTANVAVDLTGTKKLYVLVSQAKIDDGSSNALDGTGIWSIQTGASYPAWDYIPLASVISGTIFDEREFLSTKTSLLKEKSWWRLVAWSGTWWTRIWRFTGGQATRILIEYVWWAWFNAGTNDDSAIWRIWLTIWNALSSQNLIGYWMNDFWNAPISELRVARVNADPYTWDIYVLNGWSYINQTFFKVSHWWSTFIPYFDTAWAPNMDVPNWIYAIPRKYPDIQWSALLTALGWIWLWPQRIPVVFAEASSIAGKAFSVESQAYAYTPTWEVQMGSTAVTTKVAIPFYHSWVSTTSLKSYLRKVWTPTDNMVIRIETDSWDAPSGTLVHANATFNVSWASLTTSHAVITWSMTSWTATRGTKLWIVFSRQNSVDINNYYMIGTIPLDTRIFMGYKLFNASWSAKTAIGIYFESTACEKHIAILSSTVAGRTKIAWFADGVYSAWGTWYLSIGQTQSITGVTKSNYYSLSATSWDLQITPVSTLALGYCGEDGTLVLMDDVLNIPWYFYQNGIGDNTAFSGQQIRAQFYCKSNGIITGWVNLTWSFNSWGGTYYIGILRAGVWVQATTWSRVFAWESVWVVVNGSGSGTNYVSFDWNVQFTPSF